MKNKLPADTVETSCPKCSQKLRVPSNIGGMLMACPTCGQKLYSDFKIKGACHGSSKNVVLHLFSGPSNLISRLVRYFFS